MDKDILEKISDKLYSIKTDIENLEYSIEDYIDNEESKLDILRSILKQSEYGLINYRKLETKKDLIDTIKKEVLDE